MWFLEKGRTAVSPYPPVMGSGERYISSPVASGAIRSPGRQEFWCMFGASGELSCSPGMQNCTRMKGILTYQEIYGLSLVNLAYR